MRRTKRRKLIEQFELTCWLCDLPIIKSEFSFDHYLPKSFGGKFKIANLKAAHKTCNNIRGNELSPSMSKYIVKMSLGLR